MNPDISFVIRNRNEARSLQRTLESVQRQTGVEVEVIGVENDSSDESASVWSSFGPDELVQVARHEYTPGLALNRGIERAKAPHIAILSAHSVLISEDFAARLHRALADEQAAGVRCFEAGLSLDDPQWEETVAVSPESSTEQILRRGLNCACCGLRREVWERIRFDESVLMIEDKVWTRDVAAEGFVIKQGPFPYRYLRSMPTREAVRRTYRERVAALREFGVEPPSVNPLGLLSALSVGGLRRYTRDVADTWYSYRLMKQVKRAAAKPDSAGSTQ